MMGAVTSIETSLRRLETIEGRRVEFMVRSDVTIYQDRLVKMGWQPSCGGLFTRRLDDAGDVDAIFQRFSRYIELIVRQSARLEPIDWERGLAEFADRVTKGGVSWWLYGSGALAVRGLDVQPGDLDLHVDDAATVGQLMVGLLVEPVTQLRGWVADAGGRAYAGVVIEWLAGAHPTSFEPPYEQEEAAAQHLDWSDGGADRFPFQPWRSSLLWPSAGD
jgi:hypothetical protein